MSNTGTAIGYKLMRTRKDGSIGSLYVNRKYKVPRGRWLRAEAFDTSKLGLKFRPGWHCMRLPFAPHLKLTDDRSWVKVEMRHVKKYDRPKSQGGEWYLAREIRILEVMHEYGRQLEREVQI